jgi:hypothetical protein
VCLAPAADLSSDCSKPPGCRLEAARLRPSRRCACTLYCRTLLRDRLSRHRHQHTTAGACCCSGAMASTTSNIAFGDARSSLQAHTIHGSVYVGTLRGRLWAVTLTIKSRTLSRHLKQDSGTHSVVYRTPKTRPSTRTPSSTSLPASPTRASISCARYTAGQMDKTSGASSG